jgi:hypothetical protein
MKRISWFLSILGVTLGFIFGLYYAWEISPINPKDALPSDLEPHFQEEYQTLIALAYANTGNFSRATRRLEMLPESNSAEGLRALSQQHLATGRSGADVLAVAQLAAALSNPTKPISTLQQFRDTATPTTSPIPTATLLPTPSQTATPIPTYNLGSQEKICDPEQGSPMIQVLVFNAAGDPVPGIEVLIFGDQGEDHFFTGLKPEVSPGYGDFIMSEGINYTAKIAGSTQTITGLAVEECIQDDGAYPGSWLLTFEEP